MIDVDLVWWLVWTIALWHFGVGWYIFALRPQQLALLVIALMKSALGVCVLLVVLYPEFALAYGVTRQLLLPTTLALMLGVSFALTYVIFKHWDIPTPIECLRSACSRYG